MFGVNVDIVIVCRVFQVNGGNKVITPLRNRRVGIYVSGMASVLGAFGGLLGGILWDWAEQKE